MRRLVLAIGLACVLSGMVRAGEMHSTGVVAPPPPPNTVMIAGDSDQTTIEASRMAMTFILTLMRIGR